jgi:penicillin-binding protein 1A
VILAKIFATALVLSQVITQPDAVQPAFDPSRDRDEVMRLLRAGCAQIRKTFDIEEINLDELIAATMDDPQAMTGEIKAFRGINFGELHAAYRQLCKPGTVQKPTVDIGQVIDFYNKALAELPDHAKLKGLKLPGASTVLDANNRRFTELYQPDHRRIWVPLSDIPEHVQKAFVAAEDKRFFQHAGVDVQALIRAFIGNLAQTGRPQGGSTITQQIAKNLLVGDDITYERKMREIIVASRLERTLTKAEILELYLNAIYLGRGAWGVEMAARSYFGKSVRALTLAEGALLAGLTKGPNHFSPDRHPLRAQERLAYVLARMQEEGAVDADQARQALNEPPRVIAYEGLRRDSGFYFVDHVVREAKTRAGIEGVTSSSYVIRSTIHPELQRATETALQEGLARYERNTNRFRFEGAEANLSDVIRRIEGQQNPDPADPAWQRALKGARLPLYDVHWPAAVVIEIGRDKKRGWIIRVGLSDGRVLPLAVRNSIRQKLKLHDVVYVRPVEGKGKNVARAELRTRPMVQGAALVIENNSGRILALAGGFSYPVSQLNRATQSQRQPGSAIKPLSYLAALGKGLQPNTLVRDQPITLPPMSAGRARAQDYWNPKNYDGGGGGVLTLRQALEHSRNLATVRLLDGGIEQKPQASLERVCALAMEAQIYRECVRYYPFVLGAQPVRPIDLAAFYAAIANEGLRPEPHVISSVEHNGAVIYRHDAVSSSVAVGSADRAAFYQLKSMLQGVLQRGTARSMAGIAPYVAGKTGTTDRENDAWFVGFTNDVTVAVWVGYDNADGRRRTLGPRQTGAKVAIPIFEPIIQAVWAHHAARVALSPPSPEAQRRLVALPIDPSSGQRVANGSQGAFVEYFRLDQGGRPTDTQNRLVELQPHDAYRNRAFRGDGESSGFWSRGGTDWPFAQAPSRRDTPRMEAPPGPWIFGIPGLREDDHRRERHPRRVDPDYFWGRQGLN